jgi:hypothetical protein
MDGGRPTPAITNDGCNSSSRHAAARRKTADDMAILQLLRSAKAHSAPPTLSGWDQ